MIILFKDRMRKSKHILSIVVLICFSVQPIFSNDQLVQKPRILISTDIGGTDPDDNQSMAHLLMYSDRFEIEGLVSSPSYGKGSKEEIIRMIDLFEKDLKILQRRIHNYPDPAHLRNISKQGRKGLAPFKGYDKSTEGSDWIVKCARKKSDRPLWILVWGGLEDLAQALHDAPDIKNKIKIYWIGGPNKKWSVNSYLYIVKNFPDLFFIESNATYRGFISDNKKEPKYNSNFYDNFIKGAGNLGDDFINYYEGNPKMGDTPSLLYMMNGNPDDPTDESWGGSFERMKHSHRTVFKRNTTINDTVPAYSVIELIFNGPKIELPVNTPCFTLHVDKQDWEGYYLGSGTYSVKYSPKSPATLHYTISSKINEIDGNEGVFIVDTSWPGKYNTDSYKLGNNWFTDKKKPELFEGVWQGSKTVSRWREDVLTDWGKRLDILKQSVVLGGVPKDTSYTVQGSYLKELKRFPFIKTVDTAIPKGVISFENIVYKTINDKQDNRELKLSIYRPDNDNLHPAVLMIHGGGWNSGSPGMQKALAINLAKKGFVTATVEYRLIPEALYPAGENDLNDAVKWLYDNSNNYHIDKEKIAVSGCSAGGQLAALIGTKNIDQIIKAVINMDGTSTFIHEESVTRAEKAVKFGEILPVDAAWLGGAYSEKQMNWELASPLYWVNNNSAPVCFINSSIPRFHNGRDEHISKLDSLNIYSEVHEFEDTPHTFWLFHPWHLSAVNYSANFLWKIFNNTSDLDREKYDFIVAQDGSGDFKTVQEAINAVPDFRKQKTTIFIRNGFYKEKIIIPDTKQSLTLIGEDKYKTILSFNNFASKKSPLGDEIGTSGSASVYVCPDNFRAENITFENAAGPVGQAVAIIVRSDHALFNNCRFLGFQDTLYTHKAGSKQYYKNCYIEGTVDFIFGSSTAYFDECEIFCKQNGYITAASTPEEQPYGYIFNKCKIEGDNKNSFYLGRPWRPYAHVVFIDCELSDVIKSEGWHNWGNTSNEETAKYSEYNNTGKGANTADRVTWSKQLNSESVKKYYTFNVFGEDLFYKLVEQK